MGEMIDAVSNAATGSGKCLILFPTDDAKTFDCIQEERRMKSITADDHQATNLQDINDADDNKGWDVIVIDGTWSQARKMHSKYFQEESGGSLYRVQLSDDAVKELGGSPSPTGDDYNVVEDGNTIKGHQLRRHPIKVSFIPTRCTSYSVSACLFKLTESNPSMVQYW